MTEVNPLINPESNPVEDRIKDLSSKVKSASDERDVERVARETAEAKTAEVARERDFYSQFTDVVADNPAAKEHKEEILAKVKGGYTTEDATYAVLGKAGKLGQPKVETQTIAGGSASTAPPQGGANKTLNDMTREEKLAALKEAESNGDLTMS